MSNRAVALAVLVVVLCAPSARAKELLWGDTHVHTSNSFDAYFNLNMTSGPETAYRYAKGQPVIHPTTRARIQIQTPLDFLVVADHAEFYGVIRQVVESGIPREGLGFKQRYRAWATERRTRSIVEKNQGQAAFNSFLPASTNVEKAAAARPPAARLIPNAKKMTRTAWLEAVEAADAHNEPGRFSAIIGWEWSSIPAGANLHRVVMSSADAAIASQFLPFAALESSYPEDLWGWLERTSSTTGANFAAIPHNSNISMGYMFPPTNRLRGEPIDADWARLRAKWEPVVEITQFKGDSETHPQLSPDDPFADFETYPFYIHQKPREYEPQAADYVRSALGTGLAIEERIGFNPYQFGVIGSTDSHTSAASAEEPNFWGKFVRDAVPENKRAGWGRVNGPTGWSMSASGLAAVWADDNSRDAILSAFRRREVYATTGPRIAVRVYAGTRFKRGDERATDLATLGQARGVPMGGELKGLKSAPSFLIHAAMDPKSGTLDRVQMIKGWLEDGAFRERVYNVVWSGDRRADSAGQLPALPDTVDVTTGRYSNEYGAATLAAVWKDPDFDPEQRAFYYVRVLQIPTPRHSLLDAIALQMDPVETGQPTSIQERAYTSPIHYRP